MSTKTGPADNALNVSRNMEKMFLPRPEGSRGGMWGEACINTHSSLSFYLSSLLTHFFLLLPTHRHTNTHSRLLCTRMLVQIQRRVRMNEIYTFTFTLDWTRLQISTLANRWVWRFYVEPGSQAGMRVLCFHWKREWAAFQSVCSKWNIKCDLWMCCKSAHTQHFLLVSCATLGMHMLQTLYALLR